MVDPATGSGTSRVRGRVQRFALRFVLDTRRVPRRTLPDLRLSDHKLMLDSIFRLCLLGC